MKLYGYWRSSSAYRVRIALNLKGLAVEHAPVHLARDGGEQFSDPYRAVNPAARVPALVLDDGRVLTQSLAIIDYLDSQWPDPPFAPGDAVRQAEIRSVAYAIACDIQPLGNLAVLKHVRAAYGLEDEGVNAWARHWIETGFAALETAAAARGVEGPFLFGPEPTLAEVCLTPQVYNARRFGVDMSRFPRLAACDEAARASPAFAAADPAKQPDAPAEG